MKFTVSLREIGRIFAIKLRNFKLRKMPKYLNFRFPKGDIFFKIVTKLLQRSSEIFFFLFPNGIVRR